MNETESNTPEDSQSGIGQPRNGLVQWLKNRPTLSLGILGSLLMWLALPPADLWPLAWVAPAPWLMLVRCEKLSGRRPYRTIWFAGFVFWLLSIHWLRLPHEATFLGWLALAFYLAFYLPVFISVSRVAVHRLKVPLFLAAPIVWVGLELVRAHLLSGFLMAELAHTQIDWTMLIQISDLGGSYAVDFVILLVAACVASAWPREGKPIRLAAMIPAAIVVPLVLVYGHQRMEPVSQESEALPGPTVALIQGNIAVNWKQDANRQQQIIDIYTRLSHAAVEEAGELGKRLDLIVWPETMYRDRIVLLEEDFSMEGAPPGSEEQTIVSREELEARLASGAPEKLAQMVAKLGTPILVGIELARYRSLADGDYQRYNAAVALDRSGAIVGQYEKTHLVMFGEYVPFADWIPGLYHLTPLHGGLTPGDSSVSIELEGARYGPNICYESVLPHLIRRHVMNLTDQGESPDVLVNLTNDAWYHGSSELDMHLACSVFRAIECRKPVLVAANTGLTASIDAEGCVREILKRNEEGVLLVTLELDDRQSWYLRHGDWFSGACLLLAVLFGALGYLSQRSACRELKQPRT